MAQLLWKEWCRAFFRGRLSKASIIRGISCVLEVSQLQAERFEDGKIIEHWRHSNEPGMMRQIGVIASN